MNIEVDVSAIQNKVSQCVRTDCPVASSCLRSIVRQGCSSDLHFIRIVNPDAIEMNEQGCQFFKSTEGIPYGVGFVKYLEDLPAYLAKRARSVLYTYFNSRMQYNRYRIGELRVSPERREEMERVLAEEGIPVPIVFDAIVYDFE